MLEPSQSSLVAIVGPTGSGKSELALRLAAGLNGEIVNFDSVQVYQGLNIGSAKTPPELRAGIPHHLIDIISPTEEMTAGQFSGRARECLRNIAKRNHLPLLVGGTGFYLRSLLDGLSPAPHRDADLRQRLQQLCTRRPLGLYRLLRRLHRPAAERIHPNDHQKLIRAIEIAASCSPTAPRQPLTGYRVLKIGLNPPRAELYNRINRRSAQMFEVGLLEEVEGLLQSGVPATAKALQNIGYKQALAVLAQVLTRDQAVSELQTRTRQYAKRQLTWFRRERDIQWLPHFGDSAEALATAQQLVESFLVV